MTETGRHPESPRGRAVRRGMRSGLSGPFGPKLLAALLLVAVSAPALRAQRSSIFYLELQAVTAFSFTDREVQLFSLSPNEPMQKPSVGFDWLARFGSNTGDLGYFSLQARLGYDGRGDHPFELQVYNAFFRFKFPFADLWVGHSRPALGLSYALDSHGLLLPAPSMMGFGLDRDWGVGLHRDLARGDAALSLTTGSGMDLAFNGGFLAAGRISTGIAARDNYNVGLSLAVGRIAEPMADMESGAGPSSWTQASLDATMFRGGLETRCEASVVRAYDGTRLLFLVRQGVNLLDEGRLKLEAQPAVRRMAGNWRFLPSVGLTYIISPDLTARAMLSRDPAMGGTRIVVQLYYYRAL